VSVTREPCLLQAALLGADLAAVVDRPTSDVRGFMLRDVRFYFLLFRNWLELDIREPDRDIDLTQVRRACDRLHTAGWLERIKPPRRRSASSHRTRARHVLSDAGVVGLVDGLLLGGPDRSFDEGLFVILFAASYGAPLVRRVGREALRKHLLKVLDPHLIIANLRRGLARVRADLEARIEGGNRLLAASRLGREQGLDDAQIARQLEKLDPYQLQHVRPLRELLLSFPLEVRRYEMNEGIAARSTLIFEPLLLQARAQQQILDKLELSLAAGSASD
jgi:hypothetical protein